jgi:tetratricopeptide (TPR) repeat protein
VKNCSLGSGAGLYVLTVFPGVVVAESLAFFLFATVHRWRRTLFTGIYIVLLLHIPLVTMLKPQIFAFNPLIGFFPGFTYDETLQITQRLLVYRAAVIAAAICLFTVAVLMWKLKTGTKVPHRSVTIPILEIGILTILVPGILVIYSFSDRLGLSSSEQYIRQKLVGNYKTAHFEIVYPAGSVKRERIEEIGRLHEFYYAKLSTELHLQSQMFITSFLYSSAEQKERLLGAGRTDIAKPWLHQTHINVAEVEYSLKHEMTHVLASEFGWSPLKIARNSGLIEGLAVAMERTSYSEPLDRAAALTSAAGMSQKIEPLFNLTGFAAGNAGVNYTLAGAFCRWLIDTLGIDQFKQVYATGDFIKIYGAGVSELAARWQRTNRQVVLQIQDTLKAAYLFRRPSIFGKECARIIANLNQETRQLLIRHEFEQALVSAERSLALTRTAEAVSQKATALFELHRFQAMIEFLKPQLYDSTFGFSLVPLRIRLGDAYWALDSLERAAQQYNTIASIHLAEWSDEACIVRWGAMTDAHERSELRPLLIQTMDDTIRMNRLASLNSPVAKYLLANEYLSKDRFGDCIQVLEQSGPMRNSILEYFRLSTLGRAYMKQKEYQKARSVFSSASACAPAPFLCMKTNELIEQCESEH